MQYQNKTEVNTALQNAEVNILTNRFTVDLFTVLPQARRGQLSIKLFKKCSLIGVWDSLLVNFYDTTPVMFLLTYCQGQVEQEG